MVKSVFRAFRNHNYRLFFFGHGVSLIGTWMQQIALGWYIYRLTASPFWLGMISFSGHIPSFFLTLFAGVIADRYSRHKLIIITQIFAMIQAFLLSYLVISGSKSLAAITVVTLMLGVINAFDAPVRQTFVFDMLENKDDMSNAIALNSGIFNSARLVGPSVAGFVVYYWGEGVCFLLNAFSYIAVIWALWIMKIGPCKTVSKKKDVLTNLKEGFNYSMSFMPIRSLLALVAVSSLLGMSINVLMPVFARDVLHGDSKTLGFLMGGVGVGALAGVAYLASRKKIAGIENVIVISTMLLGIGLVMFSRASVFAYSLVSLFFTGVGMISTMASSNTFLQTISDEDKRGRVISLYVMALIGMAPFGSLFAGFLSEKIGAQNTILLCGILCIANSLFFYSKLKEFKRMVRPILIKKGIN